MIEKPLPTLGGSVYVTGLSDAEWSRVPLALRQRWWSETEYGLIKPSDELVLALWKAAGRETDDAGREDAG